MRSSGSLEEILRISSLWSASPGTMANLPLFGLDKASFRNNKLKSDSRFTPPWQVMQRLFRIGFTCVLKSTRFTDEVINQRPEPTANTRTTEIRIVFTVRESIPKVRIPEN